MLGASESVREVNVQINQPFCDTFTGNPNIGNSFLSSGFLGALGVLAANPVLK